VRRFAEKTRALRLSAALDYSGQVGSLVSERQLRGVTRHVDDARDRGARVLAGGRPRPDIGPYFYEPTILADVRPGMLAFAEETFGPVVSVYAVPDDDAAITAANDSAYGLNGSIWTRDTRAAAALAARLEVGLVNVNEAYAAAWGSAGAAAGGVKASGLGRRHGVEGLLQFTTPQTIAVQRLVPMAPVAGLTQAQYARLLTWALRLRRWVPGIR
jgi:succinate-semialdehyde dehydrogenase/glutarate-semialdehyde dehydrogenase